MTLKTLTKSSMCQRTVISLLYIMYFVVFNTKHFLLRNIASICIILTAIYLHLNLSSFSVFRVPVSSCRVLVLKSSVGRWQHYCRDQSKAVGNVSSCVKICQKKQLRRRMRFCDSELNNGDIFMYSIVLLRVTVIS